MMNYRSMLFIPGNNPGMLQSADVFDADSIIFDLEDSVSLDEKDSARTLVYEVLKTIPFDTDVVIRINPFDSKYYDLDIDMVKKLPVHSILLPKASCGSVKDLALKLKDTNIKIIALIETALGIERVFDILSSSERCIGMMLGGEDLCVDLNCERTKVGSELLYSRGRVVSCAHALKKMVIDTPFTDTFDESGLEEDTQFAKSLGFDGKASINPRQINSINEIFSPTKAQIYYAIDVVEAREKALKEGKGVFSLQGKMVDLPIIKRAENTLAAAENIGLIKRKGETYEYCGI